MNTAGDTRCTTIHWIGLQLIQLPLSITVVESIGWWRQLEQLQGFQKHQEFRLELNDLNGKSVSTDTLLPPRCSKLNTVQATHSGIRMSQSPATVIDLDGVQDTS